MSKEVVWEKNVRVCVFACVCCRLQSTVYANWQAIGNNQPQAIGNNQPQARNDCDGESAPAAVVYASVVFGPEKMQQKWDNFFQQNSS